MMTSSMSTSRARSQDETELVSIDKTGRKFYFLLFIGRYAFSIACLHFAIRRFSFAIILGLNFVAMRNFRVENVISSQQRYLREKIWQRHRSEARFILLCMKMHQKGQRKT